MAIYRYEWGCNGCGSGSSCSFNITRDGVFVNGGTVQLLCSVTDQLGAIVSIVPYGVNDTAYSNGVQIYPVVIPPGTVVTPPGSSSSSGIIMLALAAVAVMLLFGKKGG